MSRPQLSKAVKICPVCQIAYLKEPNWKRGLCCSDRCLKRYDASRDKLEPFSIPEPPDNAPRDPYAKEVRGCQVCGGCFLGRSDAAFCSPECSTKGRGTVRPTREPIPCEHCGEPFLNRYRASARFCTYECARAAYIQPEPKLFPGVCAECNKPFMRARGALFCSDRCCDRVHTRIRRALKRKAFVEDVPLGEIFEAAQGKCQLCGEPVDPDLEYPDPFSASVDHYQPLSRGGLHSRENLKLAHLRCNLSKGAQLPN